jgi:hypothetical protein
MPLYSDDGRYDAEGARKAGYRGSAARAEQSDADPYAAPLRTIGRQRHRAGDVRAGDIDAGGFGYPDRLVEILGLFVSGIPIGNMRP